MDSIILNRISDGYIISAQSQASICTVNAVNIRSGYNSTSELLGNIIKLDHDYIFFKNVTAVYFKDDKFTDYNNTEIKPLEIVIHEDFADIEFSKYVKFNYYDNGVMHNTCELNMGEAFRQAIQTDLIRILGNPNLHISRGFYNEIGDSKRRISDVYPRTLIEMNLENYNNTEQRMSLSSVSEKLMFPTVISKLVLTPYFSSNSCISLRSDFRFLRSNFANFVIVIPFVLLYRININYLK